MNLSLPKIYPFSGRVPRALSPTNSSSVSRSRRSVRACREDSLTAKENRWRRAPAETDGEEVGDGAWVEGVGGAGASMVAPAAGRGCGVAPPKPPPPPASAAFAAALRRHDDAARRGAQNYRQCDATFRINENPGAPFLNTTQSLPNYR